MNKIIGTLLLIAFGAGIVSAEVPGCPVVGIKATGEFYSASERRCFKNATKATNKGYVSDDSRSGTDGWVFTLSGDEEVPPVTTAASGDCLVVLSSDDTTLNVMCTHTVSSPAAAHVHSGVIGVDGPVICDLDALGTGTSPISGTCALTADDITNLKAGQLYINVHSAGNSGGEIRGQID